MPTFKEFTNLNKKRCEESFFPLDNWSLSDWATALAGECGEMCNLIKKRNRGEDIKTEDIGKEIADIVTYADLLASRLGLSLEDIVIKKFNEVSDRKKSKIKL